jgi:hypothetical protein
MDISIRDASCAWPLVLSSSGDRGIRNMRVRIGDRSELGRGHPGRLAGKGVTCCCKRKRNSGPPTQLVIS